jgi:hypothetical protein
MKNKGQEEMVGFALIVIIMAVILLVFLSFSLREEGPEAIESHEIDNFVLSILHYTIEDNVDINDLIRDCKFDENCDILERELNGILEEIKGYNLKIIDNNEEIFNVEKGNVTQNYKVGFQEDAELEFTVYY